MIRSLNNLIIRNDKPWLVLGKGPSFSRIHDQDLSQYYTFCLNETINKVERCNIGHVVDLEVLPRIEKWHCKGPRNFLIPYYPHLQCKVTNKCLPNWIDKYFYLKQMDYEDRLTVYNLSTYKGNFTHPAAPFITAKYFSVEAAFRILGNFGIRQIYTLGIDGGNTYAKEFSNLKPLTNGQPNFDRQFAELQKIVHAHKMAWVQL